MGQWLVQSETGLRRLINFSDAVVAIAITLLILPLVDAASSIGHESVSGFLHHNETKLLAFFLSFFVIGRLWWGQHQVYERVSSYNSVLVAGMSLWLLSIVFLPFPTELLSSANHGSEGASHAIYVGTLLVAAVAGLIQRVAIVLWPHLQIAEQRGSVLLYPSVIFVVLMAAAFVIALLVPSNGLWALLLLLLSSPLERLVARRQSGQQQSMNRQ
jgi:uncharacterized membrane protein